MQGDGEEDNPSMKHQLVNLVSGRKDGLTEGWRLGESLGDGAPLDSWIEGEKDGELGNQSEDSVIMYLPILVFYRILTKK